MDAGCETNLVKEKKNWSVTRWTRVFIHSHIYNEHFIFSFKAFLSNFIDQI